MGADQNREWGNAWVKRYAEPGDAVNRNMIHSQDEKFAIQRQEIAHTMAVQQQAHKQFLATMAEGTRNSIARANEGMYRRSAAASDMVDFSLDRQTVMDANTGVVYKVTNQLTPGGSLVKVHGDGTF
jgi:hypothetical protein